MKESTMKKASEDMQPEYDFSRGVRGKYAVRFRKGTNLVVLEPDIAEFFSDSAAVNDALRALVEIAKRSRKPSRRVGKAS
jgi:dsDNA-specific endonuclease/ATPase MutS2